MRLVPITRLLVAFTALLAWSAVASGAVLFQDDFEDDAAGSAPAITGSNIGASWTRSLPSGNTIQVQQSGTPAAGDGSQRYVRLERQSGATSSGAAIGTLISPASGIVTATYDLFLNNNGSASGVQGSAQFNAFDGGTQLVNVLFRPDGSITAFNGSTFDSIAGPGSFARQDWETIAVTIDLDTATYAIDVNATNVVSPLSLRDTAPGHTVSAISFSPTNTSLSFIDNVNAAAGSAVPEPGSLGLAALGVCLGVRRWRRCAARGPTLPIR